MEPPTIVINQSTKHVYFERLEVGSNFSMKCMSKYPITWRPFKVNLKFYAIFTDHFMDLCIQQDFAGNCQVDDIQTEHQYESTIHLFNVNHLYVGSYFCVDNRTQFDYDYSLKFLAEVHNGLVETKGLNRFYVYVIGKKLPTRMICLPDITDEGMVLLENSFFRFRSFFVAH